MGSYSPASLAGTAIASSVDPIRDLFVIDTDVYRKSKLRCDHVVPKCSRCVRRKCAEKCVYHPNPLTKVSGVRSFHK